VRDVVEHLLGSIFAAHAIPFVGEHERCDAAIAREATHPRVLIRAALVCVDEQERHVGALERAHGHQRAHVLGGLAAPAGASQPGRVDERVAEAVALEHGVDRVARGTGLLRHHDALLAEQPVHERALADVRAADHGDPDPGLLFRLVLCRGRQQRDELFERIPRAASVLGGDPARALEAEAVELADARGVLGHVDLVHDERHRHRRLAQRARELDVVGQNAALCVGHPEDRVGVADRRPRLRLDRRGQSRLGLRVEAAVSTTSTRRPSTSTSSTIRSRVMPGRSSTSARRWPA
jgi:hypothetical protein